MLNYQASVDFPAPFLACPKKGGASNPYASAANATQEVAWIWQAWPPGIHVLSARAVSADGQTGYSQTVLVNVLTGDGVMQVNAEGGPSLVDIGSQFGIPPETIINSNPKLDPSAPLPDGQPVKIPIGGAGSGNEPGQGSGQDQPSVNTGGFNPIFVTWTFTPIEPVEKSYCYTSTGNGIWEKIPNPPFDFLNGFDPYTQFGLIFPAQKGVIQMQCWGWLGGVLKFLGQGETQFDLQLPPNEVKIAGGGFVMVGLPKIPPIKEDTFLAGGKQFVPPPYALREPQSSADCAAHGHPILAGFVCNTLMNAKVKQHIILEWEWAPKFCWGGNCQWFDTIDGYRLYEIDPITKAKTFLKDIKPSAQKVTAVPLPWGAKCYGLEAYVSSAGVEPSDLTTYCPGDPLKVQKVTLQPVHWLTTGGEWIQDGSCAEYGGVDTFLLKNQNNGLGNQSGQVLVGSYIVDDDGCYREGAYTAGVLFNLQFNLPAGAVVQNADLHFSKVFLDYGATGLATPKPASCIKSIGKAKNWKRSPIVYSCASPCPKQSLAP